MKTIKQTLVSEIAICRFDNGEGITFTQDTPVEVDDATANYLLNEYTAIVDGEDLANFVEVI